MGNTHKKRPDHRQENHQKRAPELIKELEPNWTPTKEPEERWRPSNDDEEKRKPAKKQDSKGYG